MTIEIKWHDTDPETGERRYLAALKFAGVWSFRWKLQRRGPWTRGLEPTREMWEYVLDGLKRRYRRLLNLCSLVLLGFSLYLNFIRKEVPEMVVAGNASQTMATSSNSLKEKPNPAKEQSQVVIARK